MPHLYPLTKEKFMELHREAWEYGWTYGPGFDELYDDYLINWVYFVDYLDLLINACVNIRSRQYKRSSSDVVTLCFDDGQVKYIHVPDYYGIFFNLIGLPNKVETINIFVGEAPPSFDGNEWLTKDKRTYFYNPTFVGDSDWLEIPVKIFSITETDKVNKLAELAKKSFVLIDIFPFPIIQDTEIRKKITGEFSSFLEKHFVKKYKSVLEYIYNKKFEEILKDKILKRAHAIAMPLYGSLQITFGPNSRIIMDSIEVFETTIELKHENRVSEEKWEIVDYITKKAVNVHKYTNKKDKKKTDQYKFIENLLKFGSIEEEKIPGWLECKTPRIPLLYSESGGLSHDKFLNSVNKNPKKNE